MYKNNTQNYLIKHIKDDRKIIASIWKQNPPPSWRISFILSTLFSVQTKRVRGAIKSGKWMAIYAPPPSFRGA
jgi:hypothetical protein